MDFIVDGLEALIRTFYQKVGNALFGKQFSENATKPPFIQRLSTGLLSLFISLSIGIFLWFAVALLLQQTQI